MQPLLIKTKKSNSSKLNFLFILGTRTLQFLQELHTVILSAIYVHGHTNPE